MVIGISFNMKLNINFYGSNGVNGVMFGDHIIANLWVGLILLELIHTYVLLKEQEEIESKVRQKINERNERQQVIKYL